jgi:prolycopene isomerase
VKAEQKYSLIIIGGGITGLSAGITWAKNNDTHKSPVLIVEKNPIVGGMVTSFKRKGFLFDTAQLIPDSNDLLEYLGISIDLKKFINYYARIFLVDPKAGRVKKIVIPTSLKEFQGKLTQLYPDQESQINKFFTYSTAMFNELFDLKVEMKPIDYMKALFKCRKVIANAGKTFKEYLNSFKFTNQELIDVFDVFAAFSGTPSERVVALMTVGALIASLSGAYRPLGGFIHFPMKMKKRFEELGGEVKTKSEVVKIIVSEGKARGIELISGERIMADTIITTIDTKVAMKKLVGLDVIYTIDKKYADKVERVKMSASAMTISLGLDDEIDLKGLGLDCGYNVITTGKGTFEKLFQECEKGEICLNPECFHTAVVCPSLTTGGKPVVIIRCVPMNAANWPALRENDYKAYKKQKEKIADFYIAQVEKYLIPRLKKHILYKDISSPATFIRYSGSPTGSNYDMAPYPDNFGLKRLKMRTPVKQLYQPKFSHGIWASMQAGLQVIDMIMNGKIMNGYSRYRDNQ